MATLKPSLNVSKGKSGNSGSTTGQAARGVPGKEEQKN
jgi:hypothetical protein